MKIKECMCNNVIFVHPETTVKDCAKVMSENHIGCTPVCDTDNHLVGIVTDRDIVLRAVASDKDICKTPISDIMTCNAFSCNCNSEIDEAEKVMSAEQIRRIPIVENNKVIGILTLGDLASDNITSNSSFCNTIENICTSDEKNAQ